MDPVNAPPSPCSPGSRSRECTSIDLAIEKRQAAQKAALQSFLRCQSTRANRGIFAKTHHQFWVIWASDLLKRCVTLFFRLRGNRRSGVFSTCCVRYNPNRCESNLLVRAFLISPIGHASWLDALYVSPLLWLSSRMGGVVPCVVCAGGGFILRGLR